MNPPSPSPSSPLQKDPVESQRIKLHNSKHTDDNNALLLGSVVQYRKLSVAVWKLLSFSSSTNRSSQSTGDSDGDLYVGTTLSTTSSRFIDLDLSSESSHHHHLLSLAWPNLNWIFPISNRDLIDLRLIRSRVNRILLEWKELKLQNKLYSRGRCQPSCNLCMHTVHM